MNIKSKDFLERVELSEKKNTKFVLKIGMLLGAISIFIALGKSFKFLLIFYGIFISLISTYSIISNIKEKRFYLKVKDYSRVKKEIIYNNITDIVLLLFGIVLIIYSIVI